MNIISFRATPVESASLKTACKKMAEQGHNQEYVVIRTDGSVDKAYFKNQLDGTKRTVSLNIQTPTCKASTILKSGSNEECRKFFTKKNTLDYVIDTYDRLKDLVRRDK